MEIAKWLLTCAPHPLNRLMLSNEKKGKQVKSMISIVIECVAVPADILWLPLCWITGPRVDISEFSFQLQVIVWWRCYHQHHMAVKISSGHVPCAWWEAKVQDKYTILRPIWKMWVNFFHAFKTSLNVPDWDFQFLWLLVCSSCNE